MPAHCIGDRGHQLKWVLGPARQITDLGQQNKTSFRLLALGYVIETIDRSDDFTALVFQQRGMWDYIPARTIGALNQDFEFMRFQGFAAKNTRHRTLIM